MAIQLAADVAEADFAWTIGSLCQINRIPFDPALLLQKFPAPHSFQQLVEALRSFGFRTGEGKIAKAAYPCVGFLAGEEPKPALLVKRDAERLLYFVAGRQTPQTAGGRERSPSARLTERQREVLKRLLAGSTISEIAADLGIAESTAKHHALAVYAAFRVSSRADLILAAARRGQATG